VTEQEVSQRVGQRLGKIMLYGLARYALNDNFCHWTGDPDRKLKQRNEFYSLARK
jgi:hypothetical protein